MPRISAVLDGSGEFANRPQRSYDDTALLMAELVEHGYDSERGMQVIRRINRIHSRFDIGNEEFLYVLSTFHFEPIRWVERFGWRKLTPQEVCASYLFWCEVGRRMAIADIPTSNAAFEEWAADYEREHFRFATTNRRVAEACRDLFLSWFWPPLRPLVRNGVYALMDEPMREAFGFPPASAPVRWLTVGLLKARSWGLRLAPSRRKAHFITSQPTRSWPDGYEIEELGPPDAP